MINKRDIHSKLDMFNASKFLSVINSYNYLDMIF